MTIQWILVAVILLFALIFVGRKVYCSIKGNNKCACCTKDCPLKQSKVKSQRSKVTRVAG